MTPLKIQFIKGFLKEQHFRRMKCVIQFNFLTIQHQKTQKKTEIRMILVDALTCLLRTS